MSNYEKCLEITVNNLKAENERLHLELRFKNEKLSAYMDVNKGLRKAIEEALVKLHEFDEHMSFPNAWADLKKITKILGEASSEPFTDVKASPKTKPLRCPSCGNNWKNKGGFTLIPNTNEIVCAACLQKFTVKPKE